MCFVCDIFNTENIVVLVNDSRVLENHIQPFISLYKYCRKERSELKCISQTKITTVWKSQPTWMQLIQGIFWSSFQEHERRATRFLLKIQRDSVHNFTQKTLTLYQFPARISRGEENYCNYLVFYSNFYFYTDTSSLHRHSSFNSTKFP